jgi:hypothetical protein
MIELISSYHLMFDCLEANVKALAKVRQLRGRDLFEA